ncbi:MAG: sulfurtransferase TusA family protein [Gammaproteobacteria bacterium]|jgi:tRNA 2-thiouridine synthesizing protein A
MRHQLDARRLLCPLPVIRTQDAIAGLEPGEVLEVACTDPGALNDIPAWCRINGHRVVETREQDGDILLVIEVGG